MIGDPVIRVIAKRLIRRDLAGTVAASRRTLAMLHLRRRCVETIAALALVACTSPRPVTQQLAALPDGEARPVSRTSCPATHPIKANAGSGIYHVPGHAWYAATHPERCFATEDAATAAGYRKAWV